MDMTYVKVYQDWTEATRKLKEAEKGRLIDAMVIYAATGEDVSDRLSGNEQYVFPMFQAQIDRDRQALESYSRKQSENGSKGGRPKKPKNPSVFTENPKNPPLFSKTQKIYNKDNNKDNNYCFCSGFMTDEEMDAATAQTTINNKKIIDAMESAGMSTNSVTVDAVISLGVEHGVDGVIDAIKKAALHNKEKAVSVAYLKAVLDGSRKQERAIKPIKRVKVPEGWTG